MISELLLFYHVKFEKLHIFQVSFIELSKKSVMQFLLINCYFYT